MRRALAGRLAFVLALVACAFVGGLVLTALAPGARLAVDDGLLSSRAAAEKRAQLGLDQSVPEQLVRRLARIATLDFGRSLRYDQPVLDLVAGRTASTLQAGLAALLLALAAGMPAGVLGSRARSPLARNAIGALSVVLLSLPALVVALVLAVIASATALPSFGVMVLALALPAAATVERAQSRAMDLVWRETCLDAARARGVPRWSITWRHAWPLSLPSVLGVLGVLAGHMLSGALAIELVTARSGLGRLTYEALMARDLDLAAGCAAAAALIVGLATLAADVLLMWVDPRSVEP